MTTRGPENRALTDQSLLVADANRATVSLSWLRRVRWGATLGLAALTVVGTEFGVLPGGAFVPLLTVVLALAFLNVAYGLVSPKMAHGGTILVAPDSGPGATCELKLPVVREYEAMW